jgi:Diphosphoinositol pentakisphosphate kinase 2 N-terminal domain
MGSNDNCYPTNTNYYDDNGGCEGDGGGDDDDNYEALDTTHIDYTLDEQKNSAASSRLRHEQGQDDNFDDSMTMATLRASAATAATTNVTVSTSRNNNATTASNTNTASTCNSNMIRLGICAMDKKARSKPMAEILSRLDDTLFDVIFFGDECILNTPIDEWPVVDVLIAFFSKGFPLEKAIQYAALDTNRHMHILNDLQQQVVLQDRRKVYDVLQASGIDVPRHVYCSHDDYISTGMGDGNGARETYVQELDDDSIVCNGVVLRKPFVEKPVNADDHNINIYYPTS